MKFSKKNKIVLGGIALILIWIAGSYMYRTSHVRYAPLYPKNEISASSQISEEELRAFLLTWIKYCQKNKECPHLPELSFDTADGKQQLDKNFSNWLERHGWNVNRFIYIESRLRTIILTIQKDKDILKRQRLMREGAQNTKDSALAATLNQAAEMQDAILNIEKISKAERYMVEPQLESVKNILQGKFD